MNVLVFICLLAIAIAALTLAVAAVMDAREQRRICKFYREDADKWLEAYKRAIEALREERNNKEDKDNETF